MNVAVISYFYRIETPFLLLQNRFI